MQAINHLLVFIMVMIVLALAILISLIVKNLKGDSGLSPSQKESNPVNLSEDPRYGEIRQRFRIADDKAKQARLEMHEKDIESYHKTRIHLWTRPSKRRTIKMQASKEIDLYRKRWNMAQFGRTRSSSKMGGVHPMNGTTRHGIGRAGTGTRAHGLNIVSKDIGRNKIYSRKKKQGGKNG